MTKSKWMTLITVIACVLIIGLVAGLIAQGVSKKKTTPPAPEVKTSGRIVDDEGNEMLMSATYAMPAAMTFSEVEPETVAKITISATISPANATNDRVLWKIIDTSDDGVCTSASIEPTFYGSATAVLTVESSFENTYRIIATSAADETIFDTCDVDYLKEFNWIDIDVSTYGNDLSFGENKVIPADFDNDYEVGSISGDVEYGEFAMTLNYGLINDIAERLGIEEFTPIYQPVNENFSADGIPYFLASPYECFAKGSGINADDFNLAFCRAVYFFEDEYPPVYISFTARYSYNGKVVTTERISMDNSYEKLYMEFSLEGLYIPVQDIVINSDDIVINGGETNEPVVCYFDSSDSSKISTDTRITVAGKQSACTTTAVNALDKSFTKYLKMESGTQITFTTVDEMTLKIYVDTAGKKIKVDGNNYTSVTDENGDNVITVTLKGGSHTITKGDVLGVFALVLGGE